MTGAGLLESLLDFFRDTRLDTKQDTGEGGGNVITVRELYCQLALKIN